jgi:hypothetical protein
VGEGGKPSRRVWSVGVCRLSQTNRIALPFTPVTERVLLSSKGKLQSNLPEFPLPDQVVSLMRVIDHTRKIFMLTPI